MPLDVVTPEQLKQSFIASKSKGSTRSYTAILSRFQAFLASREKTLFNASELDAAQFIEIYSLSKGQKTRTTFLRSNVSKYTIRIRIALLSSFYGYLVSLGVVQRNIFAVVRNNYIKAQSGSVRPTEMVPFETVKALMDAPSDHTQEGIRDRALLALLLGCGLRISEALGLKLSDVQKAEDSTPFLLLRETKSQNTQRQALADWVFERLLQLLRQRQSENATANDWIFVRYVWDDDENTQAVEGPLSGHSVRKLFRRYCKHVGLKKHLTPHSCRATVATKLLSEGWDYRSVQEVLRHSSIFMVEKYDKRRFEISQSPAKKIKW